MTTKRWLFKATVRRWVDGDTVIFRDIDLGFNTHIHNESCRLLGVDTAETRGGTSELKQLGKFAAEYVREACPAGSKVWIETELDTGKFGRTLARVYHEGLEMPSLNERLLEDRLAIAYDGGSRDEAAEQHMQNYTYHSEAGSFD